MLQSYQSITAHGDPMLRTRLFAVAFATTIFGVLHHIDHVVRGNHVGWPISNEVTPFSYSLLIYVLIVPGLGLLPRVSYGPAIGSW